MQGADVGSRIGKLLVGGVLFGLLAVVLTVLAPRAGRTVSFTKRTAEQYQVPGEETLEQVIDATTGTEQSDSSSPSPGGQPTSASATDAPAPAEQPEIEFAYDPAEAGAFPQTLTLVVDGKEHELQYTGALVRQKQVLFVTLTLYSLASYVEKMPAATDPDEQLDSLLRDGPRKAYILRFGMSLPGGQIMTAIEDEIDATFGDVDTVAHADALDRFTKPFGEGATKGDVVHLAWLPGGKVFAGFRTKVGSLIGKDIALARAIWRIWAGTGAGEARYGLVADIPAQTASAN